MNIKQASKDRKSLGLAIDLNWHIELRPENMSKWDALGYATILFLSKLMFVYKTLFISQKNTTEQWLPPTLSDLV